MLAKHVIGSAGRFVGRTGVRTDQAPKGGELGEWIYTSLNSTKEVVQEDPMTQSLTPIAIQRNWKTPSEFPACPTGIDDGTIENYAERLAFGVVFSTNTFGSATTVAAEEGNGGKVLGVVCHMGNAAVKEWTVSKVTIEGDKICHESAGSFFTLQGALKKYCEIIGVPLDDSIDDHC